MHTPKSSKQPSELHYRNWAAGKGKDASQNTLWDGGGGLHTERTRSGSIKWRIKYRHEGKERLYTVGDYPEVSVVQARAERDKVQAWLREGKDPVQAREVSRADNIASADATFEKIAEAWLEKQRKRWSAIHYTKSKQALERDVYPAIGNLPIRDITPVMVTGVIENIAGRGVRDTASKILQHVAGVFRYAQSRGLCGKENPALPAKEALPPATRAKHRPALLAFEQLGDVLRRAEAANLSRAVHMAHRLLAFCPGARIGNVVEATWREFDLDADVPTWVIPRAKMKRKDAALDHKVVLCPVIVRELHAWRNATGGKGYLFRSPAGGAHISREAIEKSYRVTLRLRDRHSPHGWRAAFATLARDNDEGHGFDRDVVELALDHIHDNAVVLAYDRGERLQKRVKLARWWGEQLDHAQRGADVVRLKDKRAA